MVDKSRELGSEITVQAANLKEYVKVCDVVDEAFKHSELESKIIKVTTAQDPKFQKGDLRIAKVNGKIVSAMMLIRRPLRIGTAVVDGAIVAPVATHPKYQGKGYCSAIMKDAIHYMKDQGFDLTILWGIPWLYLRYGYSPAMLKPELVINPEQSTSMEKGPHRFRPFTEVDLKEMTAIYHANSARRTCAEVRSPTMSEWQPGGSEVKLEVLTDKKDRVTGYRALGTDWGGHPCAHEIGVLNDEACMVILSSLIELAKEKDLKEFHCIIHPDHPFSRFAFRCGGEIRINRAGGAAMALVLNLASLLTKMKKEFEARLRSSELHDSRCNLKILSEGESVVLKIDRGRVSVNPDGIKADHQFDIPLAHLNPLVTGYSDIRDVLKNPHIKIRGGKRSIRLIEVLFPRGFPFGGCPPLVWE